MWFSVAYDFPNSYCQVWDTGAPCNASLWPLPPNQVTQKTRLKLREGTNEKISVPAVFENGLWMPTIPALCDGSTHTYTIRADNSGGYGDCNSPAYVDMLVTVTFPGGSAGPCGTPDRGSCPAGGGGAGPGSGVGQPINVGSGDVTTTIPLFTLDQPPLPVVFNLTYHSSALSYPSGASAVPVPTPFGAGWTHQYNQVLKPIPGSSPQRLYHFGPDGREFEYTQSGSVWTASRPAELRGTVAQDTASHQYVLTDLEGTVTRFHDSSGSAPGPAGGWASTTDRWGNGISGTYSGGSLVTVTDSVGRQVTLTYTGGVVTSLAIGGSGGSPWRFSYDSTHALLYSLFDPIHAGATAWRTLSYDAGGRLATISDDLPAVLEGHTYDSSGRGVTSYSNSSGVNAVSVAYGTPAAGQTTVSHKIDGSTNQVSVFTLVYQGGRWLPTEIDGPCATCGGATGDTQLFTYTPDNHVATVTDAVGNVTSFGYDPYGNMTTRTDPAIGGTSRVTTWTYGYASPSPLAPWPTFWTVKTEPSVSSGNKTTNRAWSGSNESTLTVTETAGGASGEVHTSTQGFDGNHRLTSSVVAQSLSPPVGSTTTYTYYSSGAASSDVGRLSSVTDPVNLTTTYAGYDLFGTALTVTAPDGAVTQLQTDGRGRVTERSLLPVSGDADSSTYTTQYAYDTRDRLEHVVLPNTNRIAYTHEDGTNRLLSTSRGTAAGAQEGLLYALNSIGDRVQEQSATCASPAWPCGSWSAPERSESTTYDAKNRLVAVTHSDAPPTAIHYTYDAAGRLSTVQDERHASANTTYGYDPLGRLKTVTQTLSGAAGGQIVTSYGYDVQDNLTSVTDPNGNVTTYVHDDFRRMVSQSSPVSGATSYLYDLAGNLLSTTDANGATTVRTYDAANRLYTATSTRAGAPQETVTHSWGATSSPVYSRGRLSSVAVAVSGSPTTSTSTTYDRRGLVRSETVTIEGTSHGISYVYDANGNRTQVTYPSGRVVGTGYDWADRPYSVASTSPSSQTYVSSTTYAPFGPEKVMTFGNGTTRMAGWTTRHLPASLTLTGGAVSGVSYSYALDGAGNITTLTDSGDGGYTRTFGYDDLNRLVTASASGLWGSGSYTLDSMGNRTAMTLGTRSVGYSYDSVSGHVTSRLYSTTEGASTTLVSRDNVGNETTFGSQPSAYSSRNHLASSGGATFRQDGRGLRVSESPAPGTGFFTLTPCRVFDTRNVAGPDAAAPVLGASESRVLSIAGRCDVPSGAKALSANLTAVNAAVSGDLVVFPGDQAAPQATLLSFPVSLPKASAAIVKPATDGSLGVLNRATGAVHFVLDVNGYFQETATATRQFLYGPELNLLMETNLTAGTPSPLTEYVWFGGRPVAQETVGTPSAVRYTMTDHLGTPFVQTDSSGNVTWRAEYEPYGKVYAMRIGFAADQPLRFPGQEERGTTAGRSFNVFRWYRPGVGAYTQPDPQPLLWAVHPGEYSYATANPIRLVDRIGWFSINSSCNGTLVDPTLRQEVEESVQYACSRNKPGTRCHDMMMDVSAALGWPSGRLSACIDGYCAGGGSISCECSMGDCGAARAGGLGLTLGGAGNTACPRFRNRGFGPTIFHETLHLCSFGAEPISKTPQGSWFRLLEQACTGWRDPRLPPVGPPQ